MWIQVRDDYGNRTKLIDRVIVLSNCKGKSGALDVLLVDYLSKRVHRLTKEERDILQELEYVSSRRKAKHLTHMAYSGSNIREQIKDMVLKDVSSDSIVEVVKMKISNNKFNRLAKKEINFLKKINKVKNYDEIKERVNGYRAEQRLNRKQMMSIDFVDFIKIPKRKKTLDIVPERVVDVSRKKDEDS